MEKVLHTIWLLLAVLLARVSADTAACSSYGVDYSNGGSYYIDGSSNQYFSFNTVFQGCTQETLSPVLVGPDGNQYACSNINTTPAGSQVTSTCGIPFSSMQSGTWRIILQSSQIAVQRVITLTVGVPQTTVVTATPTVTLGITSTPKASTIQSTIYQTVTLIIVGPNVTTTCAGATKTVTVIAPTSTRTITSTVIRTSTADTEKTSFYTTTITATASCHYSSPDRTDKSDRKDTALRRRVGDHEQRAANKVAAVTSTVTETTYTVTKTVVTTIPARTTTETVVATKTLTITPPATTICSGGSPGTTITSTRGKPSTTTQSSIVYITTQVTGTVYVGITQYTTYTNSASATACWRDGGWFGGQS